MLALVHWVPVRSIVKNINNSITLMSDICIVRRRIAIPEHRIENRDLGQVSVNNTLHLNLSLLQTGLYVALRIV